MLADGSQRSVPAHLGTTDADLLIDLAVEFDYAGIERALAAADFITDDDPAYSGWRWWLRIEGVRVRVEFLCELQDQPERHVLRLRGCEQLSAINLRGTGFVARDSVSRSLASAAGEPPIAVRFAGLSGYVLARPAPRVSAGSPRATTILSTCWRTTMSMMGRGGRRGRSAAVRLQRRSTASSRRGGSCARFTSPDDTGPRGYAEQATIVQPDVPVARLRNDGAAVVNEFLDELDAGA